MMLAAKSGWLRVVLFARLFHEVPATEKHWGRIMKHFQLDTMLMAYDFLMNLYISIRWKETKQNLIT